MDAGRGAQGSTDPNGNVIITLKPSMVAAAGSDPAFRPALAGEVAHEGTHGEDGRARGGDPTTVDQERATEVHAYTNEASTVQGLANAGVTGITPQGAPAPGSSPPAVAAAVNGQAEQSVKLWCQKAGPGAGC